MSIDHGIVLPPEEAALEALGRGASPLHNPATPATPASPAALTPAAPASPAALTPDPSLGIMAPQGPTPLQTLGQTVREAVQQAMPAAQPVAVSDPLEARFNAFLAGDASDEAKAVVELQRDAYVAQRDGRAADATARDKKIAEQDAWIAAQRQQGAEAALSAEETWVNDRFALSQPEWDAFYQHWNALCDTDPTAVNLKHIEALRRIYGEDAMAARVKAPGAPRLAIVPTPPNQQQGAHPQGHLASDASMGTPRVAAGSGGWTPPVRDKGPSLNDALAGAKSDPRFAGR